MNRPSLIALVTDFGNGSPYVAQMKGVIFGLFSSAKIVDVSHAVSAQDVHEAAWLLRDVRDAFPPDTIFVVVVDPGVGSDRALLCLKTNTATYLGPDNGVLSLVRPVPMDAQLFRLDNQSLWRQKISPTFHGRDIMAPVAAHLAAGSPIGEVGSRAGQMEMLRFPAARSVGNAIVGRVEYADSFGNLITNVDASQLDPQSQWDVLCSGRDNIPLVTCYADRPAGACVAVIGSNARLEIAVVNGNAQNALAVSRHDEIRCSQRD
jgi:S-adenosylmethionine hydrolase